MKKVALLTLFVSALLGVLVLKSQFQRESIVDRDFSTLLQENIWQVRSYSPRQISRQPALALLTNEWIAFRSDGLCVYHAPYLLRGAGGDIKELSTLQDLGHLYSQGFSTPSAFVASNLQVTNEEYIAKWQYLSPMDDPKLFDRIERADAIITVSFYENGNRRGAIWLRIQSETQDRVQLEDYRPTSDGVITMIYEPIQALRR